MVNEGAFKINPRITLAPALQAWEIYLSDQGSSPRPSLLSWGIYVYLHHTYPLIGRSESRPGRFQQFFTLDGT